MNNAMQLWWEGKNHKAICPDCQEDLLTHILHPGKTCWSSPNPPTTPMPERQQAELNATWEAEGMYC